MPVTFRHTESGREVTLTEPADTPGHRQTALARHIAKMDNSPVWERVDAAAAPASAAPDGQEAPVEAPTTENPSEAPAAAPAATQAPAAKDVRAWARVEGLAYPPRGPLPDALVGRYLAAHAEV
jgi:hypothetical protein